MRNLVDLLPSVVALLRESLQAGNGGNQYLHHDGRGDIRVHPNRGHAQVGERAPAEQVQESQKFLLLERLGQRLRIHARNRNLGHEPEYHQHPQSKQDPRAQVGHPHRVYHRLYQLRSG